MPSNMRSISSNFSNQAAKVWASGLDPWMERSPKYVQLQMTKSLYGLATFPLLQITQKKKSRSLGPQQRPRVDDIKSSSVLEGMSSIRPR